MQQGMKEMNRKLSHMDEKMSNLDGRMASMVEHLNPSNFTP